MRLRLGGLGGTAGAAMLALVAAGALLAPLLPVLDPLTPDLIDRLKAPGAAAGHLLGTDQLGRDMLARLLHGARLTLMVGAAAVLVGGAFGAAVGLISGYVGGWLDRVLMRVLDMQLAIPGILLALLVVATLGASVPNLVMVMALISWPQYARLIRGQVLTVRESDYIRAARSIGAGPWRIMLRHVLPNVASGIVVIATMELGRVMLMEASLSFLGLGVPPPSPSWGRMLAEGRSFMATGWWLTVLPGAAILTTVLAINLLGDWLRDLLDPKSQGAR